MSVAHIINTWSFRKRRITWTTKRFCISVIRKKYGPIPSVKSLCDHFSMYFVDEIELPVPNFQINTEYSTSAKNRS